MTHSTEEDIHYLRKMADSAESDVRQRRLHGIADRLDELGAVLGLPGEQALKDTVDDPEPTLGNRARYLLAQQREAQWLAERRRIFMRMLRDRLVKPDLFDKDPEALAEEVDKLHQDAKEKLDHHDEPWEAVLDWMKDAILALDDLGACNNPDCTECPNVLPRGVQLYDALNPEGDL